MPVAGGAAVVLMAALVIVILVAGNDDADEPEVASAPEMTQTAEAGTPTPEVAEATPTPEREAEIELTPTPEATPVDEIEETPVAEADPTPVPDPTPTPQPIVGDFGELPPGDMPSGSPAEAMSLNFQLDMSLQAIPSQATAYQIQRRQWTAEDVQNLANRLEIDGEVIDQGNGSFRVEGEAASLYISPGSTQYVRPSTIDSPPDLPGNEQLLQTARSWLVDNGLAGADVGQGQVLDRDESSGKAFVQLKPVEPANIISATPSAGVTVRGDGVVTEAMINWPSALHGSTYGLRPADALWADATSGRGFIDIRSGDLPPDFQGASATVSITSGGIAYTVAGSPQGTQYLVPVAVFSGTTTIEGADGQVPVSIYVQAVSAQAGPRG